MSDKDRKQAAAQYAAEMEELSSLYQAGGQVQADKQRGARDAKLLGGMLGLAGLVAQGTPLAAFAPAAQAASQVLPAIAPAFDKPFLGLDDDTAADVALGLQVTGMATDLGEGYARAEHADPGDPSPVVDKQGVQTQPAEEIEGVDTDFGIRYLS